MSSRGKNDLCRICGGALQGNQRRWLFGGQNKHGGPARTPTGSLRGGSSSRSLQSSPWGSTLSLGSSKSLSKSQLSLSSSSKGMDLLSVLTHILGQAVPRGGGQGEFVCGKCVSVLERVFKFDTVMARVKVLSSERLQKLAQERDKIRQWVRHNYHQRHPRDFKSRSRSSTSEEDGDGEKEGYREMLRDNMALSEYECWSEKWDTCPHFIKTGKRCRKGKGCEGCDSLRVSDSDYESICGVPRHLPLQPFSPLALSRDKSRSMPLHWQRIPSVSSHVSSLGGSTLSLQESSRTASVQSLDSLDGDDPFDSPGDQPVNFVLKELRSIEGRPVSSPAGSRIPVLGRRDGRFSGGIGETASPAVNRVLDFGRVENGGDEEDEEDEEDGDVLTELRDEFMPLHRDSATGRVHQAVRHLRGQLDQATSRIRTLEAELKHGRSKRAEVNGSDDWAPLVALEQQKEEGGGGGGGGLLLQSLGHSLHSRERVIQECMVLIRRLCVEEGAGTDLADKLTEKLTENLKESLSENKGALETLRSEVTQKEKDLETEMEALRKAGRDRERDLDTLNTVLQGNQDIINELRVTLEEREQLLKEVEKEKEVWRCRDRALGTVLQEKEALIQDLKEELERGLRDAQAGGGAEPAEDREGNSAILCEEVTKLTSALQEYQDMVQKQQETHGRALSSLSAQLRDARQELREKEKKKKEVERAWQNIREDRDREERKLRDGLHKRDKLIEQILLDSEERDHLMAELQQNLQNRREALSAVKHTL